MCEIQVGNAYRCQAIGIKKDVVGVVEQTYTNTVLINVIDYAPEDRTKIIELQNRVLVRQDQVIEEIAAQELVTA